MLCAAVRYRYAIPHDLTDWIGLLVIVPLYHYYYTPSPDLGTAAKALVDFLCTAESAKVIKAMGMEPAAP